jgi:hypothetical protein
MAQITLPGDFKEFLRLLGARGVEYLLVVDGVEFPACYARRVVAEIDEVPVNIIALDDLKVNKRASRRLKDLADLENLP